MSDPFILTNGDIDGIDVEDTGTLVLPRTQRKGVKLIVLTNASNTPLYLAFKNCPDPDVPVNQAEVGKGVYLSANGGAYESNVDNLIRCEIWAIHEAAGETKRLCVQIGR